MSAAREEVMIGIKVIGEQFLARGKDPRIAPMVAKIYAAIEAKPDSYFAGRWEPDAFQRIWKEVAAECVKG